MTRSSRKAFRLPVVTCGENRGETAFSGPAVLRGFSRYWPAAGTWTLETLAARAPELRGDVFRTQNGRLAPDVRRGYAGEGETLAEYAARVLTEVDDPGYFTCAVRGLPEQLAADLRPPAPWRDAQQRNGKVWVGRAGTLSPLHVDASMNLHVQLTGTKRFRVVHPRATLALRPHSPFGTTPNFCRVDLDDPVQGATSEGIRHRFDACELAPGDALFLPTGYWHEVRTERDAVSVNFWWGSGPVAWLATLTDTFKRLRGLGR